MLTDTLTIIIAIGVLVIFLSLLTVLKYAIEDNFIRTRFIMTMFLMFIVVTLTVAFRQYAVDSLYFTIPAFLFGALMGYNVGVKEAKRKLATKGVVHYIEHFAHIHGSDLKELNWWSIVNFYSIMGGLVLINLVGLSTVIFAGREWVAIATASVGAFLIGTIVPYILHLWSVEGEAL